MEPIVKWAGGKRQLLKELKSRMPDTFNCYYEPFFGGGALYFEILPTKAVINDFNSELVNLYISIRDNLDLLRRYLITYQNEYNNLTSYKEKSQYYYKKREEYNERINDDVLTVEDASLFLFLNKCCYNGLYRVNAQGMYNCPFGKKEKLSLFNDNNLNDCSSQLKKTKILCGDFENACKGIRKGDFVYFDSPYYDTFDTYQPNGFSEADHVRLSNLFKKLTQRGVYCLLSNSDTAFIKELYKDYQIDVVEVKRMINCNGDKRTGTELIIKNY